MNKRVMGPIAMILAAAICVGLAVYQVGKKAPKGEAGTYTAGTYTATAQGFGGDVTVSAVFTDAILSTLDIQGGGETPDIGGAAIPTLAEAAIAAQSADFDGVSGATYTSNAVKEALKICIAKAKGESVPTPAPTPEATPVPVIEGGQVFTGEGQGFEGPVVAELTMKDGKIEAVKLTGEKETPAIGGAALSTLESQILSAQGADIDGVSGATYTSNGAKDAVTAAIAASKGEAVPTPTPEQTPEPVEGGEVITGAGKGFDGDVVAELTMKDGKIAAVNLTGDKETPAIGGKALAELSKQVMAAQGPDIDGVSGATFTSNGVKEAVAKALGVDVPAAKPTPTPEPTPEPTPVPAGAEVKTGKGAGFGGADSIVAELTIEGGKITAVKLTGDKETPAIGGAALSKLADQVKAAQGANIDGVTGATMTSNGVKEAVAKALGVSVPAAKETPAPTPEPTPAPAVEPAPAASKTYNAGTYSATASGFNGDVTVTITVSDDAITNVSITGPGETPGLGGAAVEEMPAKIMAAQSDNIDGRTGATITSGAIKEALTAALAKAKA